MPALALRKPRSPQASSALRLLLGQNERPLRSALLRELAGSIIGGTRFEEMVDGCPQPAGFQMRKNGIREGGGLEP